ncbi:MAG TPA: PIN domain-containing protein [Deferrisomatales bacterium]|nr:PIN domain-containing protein [Deferrisomatales bacterium]
MIRLFLDANVLFTAAHNPEGKAALVVAVAGANGPWELVTSGLAEAEARRNLSRKYPAALERLEEVLRGVRRVSPPPPHECPVPLEEKDRPILHAAIVAQASHLLTGDLKHFGPHMNRPEQTGGITIQTVGSFLEAWLR